MRIWSTIARLFILTGATSCILISQPKFFADCGSRFDLGDIPQNIPVQHLVAIRNNGTDTLIISELHSSCGCTGTLMTHDHILPGDSGILSITFNPSGWEGHIEKKVSMSTNDTGHSNVEIFFTANIIKILKVDPEYFFMRSPVDSAVSGHLTLTNIGSHPLRFLSVRSLSPLFAIQLTKDKLDPGEETTLTGSITPRTAGPFSGDVELQTDNPKLSTFRVRFFVWAKEK